MIAKSQINQSIMKLTMVILILTLGLPSGTLASITSSDQNLSSTSYIDWLSDEDEGYSSGTGYDYAVQEWINAHEAFETFPSYYSHLPEVGIAIFDTGIDPDVWQWIESQDGNIVKYIRPSQTASGSLWLYITPTSSSAFDDHDNGHGSAMAGTIWQVAQTAKYYIFDINDMSNSNLAEEMALKWIVDNPDENIRVITQSVKHKDPSTDHYNVDLDNDGIKKETLVDTLYSRGVSLFTSGGNLDTCPSSCDRYPDKYSEFIPIAGHQVWYPETGKLQTSSGPNILFTMPSDIEAVSMDGKGDDAGIKVKFAHHSGSSIATPLAAGAAAVVNSAYYYVNGAWPSVPQLFEILRVSAEVKFIGGSQDENIVPKPELNDWVYGESNNDNKVRKDGTGWGVIDLYDAIIFVIQDHPAVDPSLVDATMLEYLEWGYFLTYRAQLDWVMDYASKLKISIDVYYKAPHTSGFVLYKDHGVEIATFGAGAATHFERSGYANHVPEGYYYFTYSIHDVNAELLLASGVSNIAMISKMYG